MAIAGGVLLSTIVSFFLVPPLYALLVTSGRQLTPGVADEVLEAGHEHNLLEAPGR